MEFSGVRRVAVRPSSVLEEVLVWIWLSWTGDVTISRLLLVRILVRSYDSMDIIGLFGHELFCWTHTYYTNHN